MRKTTIPDLVAELRQVDKPDRRHNLLQRLRNELVGHYLRKEAAVKEGVVPVLSQFISIQGNLEAHAQLLDDAGPVRASYDFSTFILATNIVNILVSGGPPFVRTVLDSDVVRPLVETLCLLNVSVHASLAILKCLNSIANNLPPSEPTWWREDKRLSQVLYQPPFIAFFRRTVLRAFSSTLSEALCSQALLLVSKTCKDGQDRHALGSPEIMGALSTRLASFIVADGYVFPNLNLLDQSSLPPPAPPYAQLFQTLQILAMLIDQCHGRAKQILVSHAIVTIMPKWQGDFRIMDPRRPLWGAHHTPISLPRSKFGSLVDTLLPRIPQGVASLAGEQANFPPLGSVVAAPKRRSSSQPLPNLNKPAKLFTTEEPEEDESPLIGWLVHIVRMKDDPLRLMAAGFLICLLRLGFVKKSRMRMLGMILVPLLVGMLEDEMNLKLPLQHHGVHLTAEDSVAIQIPELLASLILDEEELQNAAVDAGAIKLLAQGFKATFDASQTPNMAMWTPQRQDVSSTPSDSAKNLSGWSGPTAATRQNMARREGLLKALAAVAPFNEEYRKAICDHGILPCLIDSLKAIPHEPLQSDTEADKNPGNPAATLMAACSVTQALTRSVSALRTNLIDAGIAPPILKLLLNTDPEVKIAATRVVGNLAMDFSPMKENIIRQSVIRSLCEQAHSANPRLRLESLWALKHLVLNSSNSIKINVIQELGPSWIKQLISTDPLDIPPGVVIGLMDMEFPPRMHYLSDLPVQGQDIIMKESWEADDVTSNKPSRQQTQPNDSAEDDPNRHTVEHDTLIQEQLLDLVRNLFCGDKASEIIDYVFSEMDKREFFDILVARLRYRTVHGPTRRENKSLPPPTAIVVKVLYIIVHIAASQSRFRTLISSNTVLLRQILVHCGHPSSEVRTQISWIAINLTYLENKAEEVACRQRAADLQKAGYLSKLVATLDDMDMDVRERTKTAVHLLRLYSG